MVAGLFFMRLITSAAVSEHIARIHCPVVCTQTIQGLERLPLGLTASFELSEHAVVVFFWSAAPDRVNLRIDIFKILRNIVIFASATHTTLH